MHSPFRKNAHSPAWLAIALLSPAGAVAAGLTFAPASVDFGPNALGESRIKAVTLRNTMANDIVLGESFAEALLLMREFGGRLPNRPPRRLSRVFFMEHRA